MSGCPYDCIYKASTELDDMIGGKLVEYKNGLHVYSLEESHDKVIIKCFNDKNSEEKFIFDRVFLAAGAVSSARIVLRSKNMFDEKLKLLTTVGFAVPLVSVKRMPLEWPSVNTQPGVFLEYKVDGLSDHWVHTQLSTPNELVLNMLGVSPKHQGFFSQ